MRAVAALLGIGFGGLVLGSVVGAEWLMAISCVALFFGVIGSGVV